jgi:hypothetical protein
MMAPPRTRHYSPLGQLSQGGFSSELPKFFVGSGSIRGRMAAYEEKKIVH